MAQYKRSIMNLAPGPGLAVEDPRVGEDLARRQLAMQQSALTNQMGGGWAQLAQQAMADNTDRQRMNLQAGQFGQQMAMQMAMANAQHLSDQSINEANLRQRTSEVASQANLARQAMSQQTAQRGQGPDLAGMLQARGQTGQMGLSPAQQYEMGGVDWSKQIAQDQAGFAQQDQATAARKSEEAAMNQKAYALIGPERWQALAGGEIPEDLSQLLSATAMQDPALGAAAQRLLQSSGFKPRAPMFARAGAALSNNRVGNEAIDSLNAMGVNNVNQLGGPAAALLSLMPGGLSSLAPLVGQILPDVPLGHNTVRPQDFMNQSSTPGMNDVQNRFNTLAGVPNPAALIQALMNRAHGGPILQPSYPAIPQVPQPANRPLKPTTVRRASRITTEQQKR